MEPAPLSPFHFLQFRALLGGEIRRDFTVSFGERLSNAPPGFRPDRFELRRSLIDDGGNFRELFVR